MVAYLQEQRQILVSSPIPVPEDATFDVDSWDMSRAVRIKKGEAFLLSSTDERVLFTPSPITLFMLTELPDPGYHLLHPIVLDVEQDDDLFVAHNTALNVYGAGENPDLAVREFADMLVDVFEELQESEEILSGALQQQLDDIRIYLSRN